MEKNALRKVIDDEIKNVKNTMLSIDCGEVAPDSLPLQPQFYVQKKNALEQLAYILDIEERVKSRAAKATAANNAQA